MTAIKFLIAQDATHNFPRGIFWKTCNKLNTSRIFIGRGVLLNVLL
jgi:hypothetical protein